MHESFLRALTQHRPTLRSRWEQLLRAERISSPLANPDTLVYLMDYTLDRLLDELRNPRARRRRGKHERSPCPCGRNPLLAYFQTAEQAIVETLFVTDGPASLPHVEREHSLEALKVAIRDVGRQEIEAFCAVCQRASVPCPVAAMSTV